MATTFINTMIPGVSQATTVSSNYKNATNVDSINCKSFATVLSSSAKAKKLNTTSLATSDSSDTDVHTSDPNSQGLDQDITQPSTTEQSDVATKKISSTDLASNEPVADDKSVKSPDTTAPTPLVSSSDLLMMLLQMNTLVTAPAAQGATTAQPAGMEVTASTNVVNTQTAGIGATASNNAVNTQATGMGATASTNVVNTQTAGMGTTASTNAVNTQTAGMGTTASTNAVNTQAAVLQLATAPTKAVTTTATTDFATLLSTMSDNSVSLTSGQLVQALEQLTKNNSATSSVPTPKAEGVTADGDTPPFSTVGQGSTVSLTSAFKQSSIVTAVNKVTQGSDILPQTSLIANASVNQPSSQAAITASQQQDSNPLLAVLQTQLGSKFSVDQQGSALNAKGGVKAVDTAKNDASSLQSLADALSDNVAAATKASPQEHNSFQFDSKQLLQPSSDGPSSNLSDTTLGSFVQALSSEQNHFSTTITENVPQQATASKDSFQVVQQIVDQVKLVTRAQNTEMVIKLNPDHLGELTLKVTVEQGQVNATFHSNNSEVRSVIESSLPQLKQDLANSGLKVDNVGVYTGLDQSTSNQQNQSQNQPQLKFVRKGDVENFDDVAQLVEANQSTATDGVDYRI